MKVGEIWESKDQYKEKVILRYIEHFPEESESSLTEFVGYSYLEQPIDHEQPMDEEMVERNWFVNTFKKCR